MKFGKTILAEQWGPWQDVYVPYKQLKKILRASHTDATRFADSEGAFVTTLLRAIRLVDDFFESQEELLQERLAGLQACAPEGEDEQDVRDKLSHFSREIELISEGVQWLRAYSQLNRTAIRKILKKHDKASAVCLAAAIAPFVDERSFSSLHRLDAIVSDAQTLLRSAVSGRTEKLWAAEGEAGAKLGGSEPAAPPHIKPEPDRPIEYAEAEYFVGRPVV